MSTLKVESLRHYDADSDALTLSSSGTITFNGTLVGATDSAQVQSQFDSAFPSAFDTRFALQDTHDSVAVQAQIDSAAVTLTGNQTVAGIKTFSDSANFDDLVKIRVGNGEVNLNGGASPGDNFANRVAPLTIGFIPGVSPASADSSALLFDGNQIEQAMGTNSIYLNYNSPANVRMVEGGGNVGIATSSPAAKLHVAGSFRQTAATVPFEWTVNAGAVDYYKLNAVGYSDNVIVANANGDVAIGVSTPGSPGLSVATGKNIGFQQSNGESLANMFRQNTSGAFVLSEGYQYSSTTNGWASSFSGSLSKTAVWLGNSIRFYADPAATVSAGTDVTPTERMRIDNNGHVTTPYQPRFHAYGAGSTSQNTVVVYPSTYVNTGSHYNTSNGRFTAPVAGDYLFFWSAIGNATNDVYRFFIQKNGSRTISGTGNDIHLRLDTTETGSAYAPNGSRVQMFTLAANDYVDIYFYADAGNSHYVGSDYVNFGGYLLG